MMMMMIIIVLLRLWRWDDTSPCINRQLCIFRWAATCATSSLFCQIVLFSCSYSSCSSSSTSNYWTSSCVQFFGLIPFIQWAISSTTKTTSRYFMIVRIFKRKRWVLNSLIQINRDHWSSFKNAWIILFIAKICYTLTSWLNMFLQKKIISCSCRVMLITF